MAPTSLRHRRDHPRACGEQLHAMIQSWMSAGSSPRVRGAVALDGGEVTAVGIIPARAGSSPDSS